MNDLTTGFELSKPEQTIKLAVKLQEFVKQNGLTATIQGKVYPLVESWQWAAAQLGLVPIVQKLDCISSSNPITGDAEIKYSSHVDLVRISDGMVMSRGFAICSNKEPSKRRFDEYAIASMAQTRAVGKSCRNLLAWLMKAAGFEATPAEEMDFIKDEVGNDGRDFLLALLESSSYEGKVKDKLAFRIGTILTQSDYDKAKTDLMNNQVGIDSVTNPSAKQVNNHVSKIAKQPA